MNSLVSGHTPCAGILLIVHRSGAWHKGIWPGWRALYCMLFSSESTNSVPSFDTFLHIAALTTLLKLTRAPPELFAEVNRQFNVGDIIDTNGVQGVAGSAACVARDFLCLVRRACT